MPLVSFDTPWKHQKTSGVFHGVSKESSGMKWVMHLSFQLNKSINFKSYHQLNCTYNPGQGIWNKVKKYSKIAQEKKTLISTFAYFLTIVAKVLFPEDRLLKFPESNMH